MHATLFIYVKTLLKKYLFFFCSTLFHSVLLDENRDNLKTFRVGAKRE